MIEGVRVIQLNTHEDDRGSLIEVARNAQDSEPHSIVHQFGQIYLVTNPVRGTIRAFHKHSQLWDWFFIGFGSAKFVFKDDRPQSATAGNVMTIISTARNPKLIAVPPGVFHGWMSLEDHTQLISIASHTYNRSDPDEERMPADSFGDVWTVEAR